MYKTKIPKVYPFRGLPWKWTGKVEGGRNCAQGKMRKDSYVDLLFLRCVF